MDDISCVILHTAGLPPAARDCSVPRPLARAASCNDEANELYQQWRLEKERNPSNHRPKARCWHGPGQPDGGPSGEGWPGLRGASAAWAAGRSGSAAALLGQLGRRAAARAGVRCGAAASLPAHSCPPRAPLPAASLQHYFKHLYCGEEAEEGAASTSDAAQQHGQPAASGGGAAAAASASRAPEAPASPASPLQLRDAPQYSSRGGSSGGGLGALPPPPPALRDSGRVRSGASAGSEPGLGLGPGLGSSGALHRMDDISSQSPHSSYGDFGSESEPSTRR